MSSRGNLSLTSIWCSLPDINQITDPAKLAAGPNNQALRPFPLWGTLRGNNYNGISNYNSLQTTVQKRYSSGLTFQLNYVWSHFLDDLDSAGWGQRGGFQFWQIGNDPKTNYGNSNFDIPHALKGIVSYELRGRLSRKAGILSPYSIPKTTARSAAGPTTP